MEKGKNFPSLSQVFWHLVLYRIFIPLLILGFIIIIVAGNTGKRNYITHQKQVVQCMGKIIDDHLDYGDHILDTIARIAETSQMDDLSSFMVSTWEVFQYFDTIYYLDGNDKVRLMVPSDLRYNGLDMSNLYDFKQIRKEKNLVISRPFVSFRTGNPTVYLIKPLSNRGCVIGELNLELLQQQITNIKSDKDYVFIMDQTGMLLAHPDIELVKQQINMSNLEIFQRCLSGKDNAIYTYNGIRVFGNAAFVKRTGWVVVDQIPLTVFWSSYICILGMILFVLIVIWMTLLWSLRKRLQRYVITPFEQFSKETNALTVGDFSNVNFLSSIPTAFSELNNLAADFQYMSNNLQLRETALEKANVMLAEEIIKLNHTKEELTTAKKEAENSNIAKGNFISNVSHELRTPIAVILSIIQLIELNIANNVPINQQKASNHIKSMKQNCYRLLRLVNNIIDVTKIDAGFTDLNLNNLNIVSLIEEITASVLVFAKGKGIRVIFDTNSEEIIMAVDADKIEKIILNLLSNAIKFTPKEGEIHINIYDHKTIVQISIEDNGIGIQEEKKELIFERFQQIDNTFTRKNEGSGIGLSIVKNFTELHGGSITVSSELGKGSKFLIELPITVLENYQIKQKPGQANNDEHLLNIEFSDIYL